MNTEGARRKNAKVLKIGSKEYDVRNIEDPAAKLEREFVMACITSNPEVRAVMEQASGGELISSPLQRVVNEMVDAGKLDTVRVQSDMIYRKTMLSCLVSALLTNEHQMSKNLSQGLLWPLDLYEIEK